MPDFTDLLYGPDELAQQKIRALAAALSGREAAGMLGQLTGDKVLAPFGASLTQRAQHGQDALNEVPQMRLKMAMERLQQEKAQQEAALRNSPAMGGMAQQILGRTGFKPQAGALPAELQAMLPGAEKAASIPKFQAVPVGSAGVLDVHGGKVTPIPGSENGGYSPDLIDKLARQSLIQGSVAMPPGVRGPLAAQIHSKIATRMYEIEPEVNMPERAARYHADKGSLASFQKNSDAIDAFEQTAGKNLDQFLGLAKAPIDTGSPLINKPLRAFDEKVLGAPEMTAFNVARQVAVNEIAKVLSNPGMGGVLSDNARHEVESLIGKDATLKQIYEAARILKTDMANRKGAMTEQRSAILARMTGGAAPAPAAAPPPPGPKRKIYDPVAGTLRDGP